jgi:alpha-tubulin suppressor-like RCC1 family protein
VKGDHSGKFITYIEAGGYHNAAIDMDGNLYMWGRSDVG